LSQGQTDDKKRVPVPAVAGSPHALAEVTGCPEGIIARRTAAPLAQSAFDGKFSNDRRHEQVNNRDSQLD
jgi:hypothetical protein